MKQRYIIREYESFSRGKEQVHKGFVGLPAHTFDQLEQFVLSNRSQNQTDALDLMSISSRRGIGKIISARNYVGLITMRDGTEIEILPKIYSGSHCEDVAIKRVFLEMLKATKEVPYKVINDAQLNSDKMTILEVFIRMFISECFSLLKRGLKSSYRSVMDNERFFKGKLMFTEHLRYNYVHKERAFVEYDVFDADRSENRLIKSTIKYLFQRTGNGRNKKDLSLLLAAFDEVQYSVDYSKDFAQYIKNKNHRDYETIMGWCRLFLSKGSFTTFSGSEVAHALLFPMEQVFESYVSAYLGKKLNRNLFSIKLQDRQFHMFDFPAKKFSLRPDIVIEDLESKSITVMDTKWKTLSASHYNYGISQSDMYQMYAYHKKYNAAQVVLLYPYFAGVEELQGDIMFSSADHTVVKVAFVDVFNMEESIAKLIERLYEKG